MRVPEQQVIERTLNLLAALKSSLTSTNASRKDIVMLQTEIDSIRLVLATLLDDAPHDTP